VTVRIAALLFVLTVPIAVAVASFFRHTLVALVFLGAIPFGLVLLAVSVAMIHSVVDTFRLLGTAKRTERRSRPKPEQHRRSTRRTSQRSRIAA
jgi:hypothetical protein